jgi:hypothetical protein
LQNTSGFNVQKKFLRSLLISAVTFSAAFSAWSVSYRDIELVVLDSSGRNCGVKCDDQEVLRALREWAEQFSEAFGNTEFGQMVVSMVSGCGALVSSEDEGGAISRIVVPEYAPRMPHGLTLSAAFREGVERLRVMSSDELKALLAAFHPGRCAQELSLAVCNEAHDTFRAYDKCTVVSCIRRFGPNLSFRDFGRQVAMALLLVVLGSQIQSAGAEDAACPYQLDECIFAVQNFVGFVTELRLFILKYAPIGIVGCLVLAMISSCFDQV